MDMLEFLAHHGVKGMKWGKHKDELLLRKIAGGNQLRSDAPDRETRKAENGAVRQAYKDYKKTTSRTERRTDRREAQDSKASYILETAMKDPQSLVQTIDPQGSRLIMSGRELVEQMGNGAMMNVKYTDIVARSNSK